MANFYYFVGTSLPPLKVGEKPDITFEEFERLLKDNLQKSDYAQTVALRRYYDIQNIRGYLKGEDLDPHGNWDRNDIEEVLVDHEGLPYYLAHFLDIYERKEDRLKHYPELMAEFFREEIADSTGFLKEYLEFERELRLVLVGFRAKQLKRDPAVELQYEDPEEDMIVQILSQKDAQSYEPPERFESLKPILLKNYQSPFALYQALCEYRFEKIEKMVGLDVFSFKRVLGYLAQLIIVEKWLELDKKKGLEIVDKIVKGSS